MKASALREFIGENIAPGSLVISDGLSSYPNALPGSEYEHNPINVKRSGLKAHQVLPGIHLLFSSPSGGWKAHIRVPPDRIICSPIWTNLSSGSTAAPLAGAAYSSSG